MMEVAAVPSDKSTVIDLQHLWACGGAGSPMTFASTTHSTCSASLNKLATISVTFPAYTALTPPLKLRFTPAQQFAP